MMDNWLVRFQFLLVFLAVSVVYGQQTFWPAAVPLAVRNPYLHTWQITEDRAGQNPYTEWSQFRTRKHVTAWSGFIRVDGVNWKFLGGWPNVTDAVLESTTITPTRTIARMRCDRVAITVTFFSPVEVKTDDLARRSFPFSYMYVDVESLDGAPHDIKLYTDISGEWVSNNNQNDLKWGTKNIATTGIVYHSLQPQKPNSNPNGNSGSMLSEDSTFYYCMRQSPNIKWQTGPDEDLRNAFTTNGTLTGGEDADQPRPIKERFPVFAYFVDLGSVMNTTSPVVWAIGQDHNPSIKYRPESGSELKQRDLFWKSKWDINNAISDFFEDFIPARNRAIQLDEKIITAAKGVSSNYADLVSLATRQAFASTETTAIRYADKSWNTTDIKAFMMNVGGNSRLTPVEILYMSSPIFLYLDPGYMGYLLQPLLQFQSSSTYPVNYAARDIGAPYPIFDTHEPTHGQGIDQSASMIILSLAHAKFTGNGTLISHYYTLLKKWADYLIVSSLDPADQIADLGVKEPGNSNLALKGIIAIKAMSQISKAVGQDVDSNNYLANALNFFATWKSRAMPEDRLLMRYGNSTPTSDGLFYNLYADRLLRTNLVPEEFYIKQATHYDSLLQTAPKYGIAFDFSLPDQARPYWTMFTAAAFRNYPVSRKFIDQVHNRVGSNSTPGVFPANYDPDNGKVQGSEASPALGAMFTFLALDLEPKEILNVALVPPSRSSSNAGTIAGAVAGSIVGLALIGCAVFFFCRKKPDPIPYIEHNPQLTLAPQYFNNNLITEKSAAKMQHELRAHTTELAATLYPPVLSTNPPSSSNSSSAVDANITVMLRNEMADLRREMHEIWERAEHDHAPPQYPTSAA